MDGQWLTSLGLGVLAFNSGLSIYTAWGDAGSVGFVLLAAAALLGLFLGLREFEQGGGRGRDGTRRTKAVVWLLTTLLTGLSIYTAWGDAGSVGFVLLAAAALLGLFLCLREFEQGGGRGRGRDDARTKAAVWVLTTLLTAMFASRAAPKIMPMATGVLVVVCLRDVYLQGRGREGGGGMNMHGQYYALAKVGFALQTCNTALETYSHSARRDDPGSAALVFVSYTLLVILTALFVRAVARAHAAEQGQR